MSTVAGVVGQLSDWFAQIQTQAGEAYAQAKEQLDAVIHGTPEEKTPQEKYTAILNQPITGLFNETGDSTDELSLWNLAQRVAAIAIALRARTKALYNEGNGKKEENRDKIMHCFNQFAILTELMIPALETGLEKLQEIREDKSFQIDDDTSADIEQTWSEAITNVRTNQLTPGGFTATNLIDRINKMRQWFSE